MLTTESRNPEQNNLGEGAKELQNNMDFIDYMNSPVHFNRHHAKDKS